MKKIVLAAAALLLIAFSGCENKKGAFIETVQCSHPVKESVDRFEKILDENGLSIFQVIDHAQNAKNAEMILDPTTLVVFGNPKMGTALMKCNQSMGMDLPLRMLFYSDYEGRYWLSYTNPEYYSLKHNIKDKKCLAIINKVSIALQTLAQEVADNNTTAASSDQNSSDQNNTKEKE